MDHIGLLIDLHKDGERQGPGSPQATRQAIALSGLESANDLQIADIGCGTGASTLTLAQTLDGSITAVDLAPELLARLDTTMTREGLSHRVKTITASMDALPFETGTLDVIWSEGAIYNIGFENGIRYWRQFLKAGGILAVSELTWLTGTRPADIEQYWMAEYPEVATASAKMGILEANGYAPLGYFPLPETCWTENYYLPVQERFQDFLTRHANSAEAQEVVQAEQNEIALYERHSAFYGYGFYIARKLAD